MDKKNHHHYPALFFVNGKPSQVLSVTDRGLHYGDGLFETILIVAGKPVLFPEHIERLLSGARQLDIGLEKDLLLRECQQLFSELSNQTGIVKIIVTRISEGRGYRSPPKTGSQRLLFFYEGLNYQQQYWQGVELSLSSYRLPYNPALAGIKHLNRLDQVLAQSRQCHSGVQESLLQGEKGEIIEGVMSNIFLLLKGKLVTPKLDKAGVKGVMREYIIHGVASDLKLVVQERRVVMDDFLQADEAFVCNSVFGIWPVKKLGLLFFKEHRLTKKIQEHIAKLGYLHLYE